MQFPTENEGLVPYRQGRQQSKCKLLTDNTGNNEMQVIYRQGREQQNDCCSLPDASSLQTGQQTTTLLLLTNKAENEMPNLYRQDSKTTKCKLLAGDSRNLWMLVSFRKDKQQQNSSCSQTGQKATKWLLFAENAESNEMLDHYGQNRQQQNERCVLVASYNTENNEMPAPCGETTSC